MDGRHYNGPAKLSHDDASVDVWLTATGRPIARSGLVGWNGRFFAVASIESAIDFTEQVMLEIPSGGSGWIIIERGTMHAGGAFTGTFRGVGEPPTALIPDRRPRASAENAPDVRDNPESPA